MLKTLDYFYSKLNKHFFYSKRNQHFFYSKLNFSVVCFLFPTRTNLFSKLLQNSYKTLHGFFLLTRNYVILVSMTNTLHIYFMKKTFQIYTKFGLFVNFVTIVIYTDGCQLLYTCFIHKIYVTPSHTYFVSQNTLNVILIYSL